MGAVPGEMARAAVFPAVARVRKVEVLGSGQAIVGTNSSSSAVMETTRSVQCLTAPGKGRPKER